MTNGFGLTVNLISIVLLVRMGLKRKKSAPSKPISTPSEKSTNDAVELVYEAGGVGYCLLALGTGIFFIIFNPVAFVDQFFGKFSVGGFIIDGLVIGVVFLFDITAVRQLTEEIQLSRSVWI